MTITVQNKSATIKDDSLITPDIIYNRFGYLYENYILLKITRDDNTELYIPLHINKKHAELGAYLTKISLAEFKNITKFVFKNFSVAEISCIYSLNRISGKINKTNHWHIELPKQTEDLWLRMSSKSKQTLRRKEANLLKETGLTVLKLLEYDGIQNIPDSLVNEFFVLKKRLMNREYNMTAQEYLEKYHVSNAYAWRNSDGTLISLVFTCEQGNTVYLENLTYNPDYEKESPGFLLFCKVTESLINKGKSSFFLGSGHQTYKQKFNSIETICYDLTIYRNIFVRLFSLSNKLVKKLKGKS